VGVHGTLAPELTGALPQPAAAAAEDMDTVVVAVVAETRVVVDGETKDGAARYTTPAPIRRPTMKRPATIEVEAPERFIYFFGA